MAITFEIYEDTGIQTGTPLKGTSRAQVDNIGWKNRDLAEVYQYVDYPVNRPLDGELAGLSVHKYNFVKISGTYPKAARLRATITGNVNGGTSEIDILTTNKARLYYKWTSIYATPTNDILNGSLYDPSSSIIHCPMFDTAGPQHATSKLNSMATNTTYY